MLWNIHEIHVCVKNKLVITLSFEENGKYFPTFSYFDIISIQNNLTKILRYEKPRKYLVFVLLHWVLCGN